MAVKHADSGSPEDRKEEADFSLAYKGLSSQLKHTPNRMGCLKNLPAVVVSNCRSVQLSKTSYRSFAVRVGVDDFSPSVSVWSQDH